MEYQAEYRVSDRVVLRAGDVFKANGGPFMKIGKDKIPLSSKGPYRFIRLAVHRSRKTIEAFDKTGAFAALHVEGRRKSVDARIVPRPYRITGKKRPPKTVVAPNIARTREVQSEESNVPNASVRVGRQQRTASRKRV